ncbi:MAG: hypothetical protein JNL60_11075 [Bacteroidia bacterium]|nr:hypothetical protein [Bacteroidia bacterium]
MKTIYLIFSFVFLQYVGVSQTETNATNQSAQSSANGCAVVYSESEAALVLKEISTGCTEVVFQSLPPVTQTLVPVKLALKKGIYSFKKDPELVIPPGYNLLIEDTMTGATYDFAKDNLFTFHVTRMVPDRFVMFISKMKNSVAVK